MFQYYDWAELFNPEEIILYLRKSRTDDPTLSVTEVLQKHEAMLDEWTERNLGGKVPSSNRFYEVVSGETIQARPAFQEVLKLIESPTIKAIQCYDVARLSRGDLEDAGRLIKLLRYTNTYVITLQRVFDLRDEYDREAFERELKQSNYVLEYSKKIMGNGRLLSVSQGNYIGSIPPYGYDKTFVMDGKRKCPTLKENPEQADIVRLIFDLYVNRDMGRTNICHYLDKLHIKPPKGKKWSPAAVKDMLENVHYIGKVKWNWRKTVTIVEDSEIIQTRPKSRIGEYLIYEGKHDGIISEELFKAAQEKQGRNHRAKATTKIRNPLAGVLYCKCGKAMSLKGYHDKQGARLSCNDQVHCNTGSCLYDEMIDRIIAILEQCIEDFEVRIKNNEGDSIKLHARLIKSLESKLQDLQARELSQWEAQSDPDPSKRMPQEIFTQLNEKLLKEKAEVQQALCDAREAMPDPVDYKEKQYRFKDALEALKDPNATVEKKNKLLKACIERIDYSRKKPERLKGKTGQHGGWETFDIELDVKLKV